MALVLPVLRLWLLLLNLYGTFKAMKPPPLSQRNTRGPSARALQLRKRELKSRLAVWVVWATFTTIERPLDATIGIITPFYNELKCIILLFLLVSRSHGAEAIFLHIIHPLLRPYTHAVDDILANLNSLFELLTLILILPWEYISHWWKRWSWVWSSRAEAVERGDDPDNDAVPGEGDEDLRDGRMRLRPRVESRARMRETERQARVIFQDIDDAQDRVRTRMRTRFAAPNNEPTQGNQAADTNAVGLRARKRVLEQSSGLPEATFQAPGSKMTGVHHLDPATISQLAQDAIPQPFPAFSHTHMQSVSLSPLPIPTPSSSSRSSHEIWYPPQSTFDERAHGSSLPRDSTHRTPSPVYPPFPSAYRFTPRRSDPPPPPPPRVVTPRNLMSPTPRRVSTGTMSRSEFDAYDGIDQFPGRSSHAGPSRSKHSDTLPLPRGPRIGDRMHSDFFQQAPESSIQIADMDMDTETLSTRDDSSANEESMQQDRADTGDTTEAANENMKFYQRNHAPGSEIRKGKRKATTPVEPLRRSRRYNDRSSSVDTDEFGFTVRPNSTALTNTSIDSAPSFRATSLTAVDPSTKKPLARTKPSLKPTREEIDQGSSDEESVKKRRKVTTDAESLRVGALAGNKRKIKEMRSQWDDTALRRAKTRRKVTVQSTEPMVASIPEEGESRTRSTRASTRQPLPGKGQTRGAEVNRRGKGR